MNFEKSKIHFFFKIPRKCHNHEVQPSWGTKRRRDEEQTMTKQTPNMKIKVEKDCLWKQRTHKITKIGDSVWLSLYLKRYSIFKMTRMGSKTRLMKKDDLLQMNCHGTISRKKQQLVLLAQNLALYSDASPNPSVYNRCWFLGLLRLCTVLTLDIGHLTIARRAEKTCNVSCFSMCMLLLSKT